MALLFSPITALKLKLHAKRQAPQITNTQLNNCEEHGESEPRRCTTNNVHVLKQSVFFLRNDTHNILILRLGILYPVALCVRSHQNNHRGSDVLGKTVK